MDDEIRVFDRKKSPQILNSVLNNPAIKEDRVFLQIWAEFCPYCKKDLPWLKRQENRMKKAGIAVVLLNIDSDGDLPNAQALAFMEEKEISLLNYFEPDKVFQKRNEVEILPYGFLLKKPSKVIERIEGSLTEERLQQWLKSGH